MSRSERLVGWDADGVIIDSRPVAFKAAEDIVALFGSTARIASRAEYNKEFGPTAQSMLVGEAHTPTLRQLHRLLMRTRAAQVAIFEDSLSVACSLTRPPLLITAAFAAGIRDALGTRAEIFSDIRGRESGDKEELLSDAAEVLAVYITDTVRDINRCHAYGIPVIAVTWGFDSAEDLARVNPDSLVSTAKELAQKLSIHSLTTTIGGIHES